MGVELRMKEGRMRFVVRRESMESTRWMPISIRIHPSSVFGTLSDVKHWSLCHSGQ